MSRIVGIDLGTTNSLVAIVESGIPLVIADSEGRRLTPSVVHYSAAAAEPIVGAPASRLRVLKPRETIYSIKRFIGRRGGEIDREELSVGYQLIASGAGPVCVDMHGQSVTPEQVSSEILKKLKRDAEQFLGEPIDRAVVTVPAYFNDAQRNATKRAGELAGFTVERILNEPTAAALAYGLDRLTEKSKIAVYDLGGGTFDLSILELNSGVFQVLSTNGNTRLGGDDLDRRVVEFLVSEIRNAGGPNAAENAPLLSRIREAAEAAKIQLSSETETDIVLPFLAGDFSFNYRMRRSQLEDLTRDIINRTRTHCLRSLSDAKLEPRQLDQVILVGGQTRMPLVRQVVSDLFGCAEFESATGGIRIGSEYHRAEGPLLNTSQNPDEAVALGAAIQAEILAGGFRNVLLLDVTPLSLGLETFGGLMNVIIPRNSTIPTKAGELFTTAVDNQQSMLIHVLQGERERAADNWSLGKFTIDFEPAPRGVARVGVQFELDANGILHVLARDVRTGREKVVEMKSAVDVNDSDVQRMVEESVEHAFEDMQARQWIEAKLQAEQMLAAARKGCADCANELEPPQRAEIERAISDLQSVLNSQGATSGDARQLKSLIGNLDQATRPLADLMMNRAMESLLRKRGLIQ
jgi:molecular chaperone DnaK